MRASYRACVGVALMIGAAALTVSSWWRSNHGAERVLSSRLVQASAPNQGTVAQRESALEQVPSGPPSSGSEPTPGNNEDPLPGDDYHDNPIAEVLARVLANDPQLRAFEFYHHRPLLDAANTTKYHQMLSDPAVFAIVEHDLLYPAEAKPDQAGSIRRLMKIDYLREAVEWKDNPRRNELITLIAEIILTDNYPPGMGMDMRLSLSGNKKELYALLDEIAPDQAVAALRASKGTRLEQLIAHFADSLEFQKRLEANGDGAVHS
jgi:hypothetical protein